MKHDLVRAFGSLMGNEPPESIEYMPAGTHTITPMGGKKHVINVTPETAERLNRQLSQMLASAGAGKSSRPFIDFDHDRKQAAAIPVEFFWDDGVRLRVEWTQAGKDSLSGRVYSYFSPEFFVDPATGEVIGIPLVGAIGALTNTPAFQTIERLAAEHATQDIEMEKEHEKTLVELAAARDEIKAAKETIEALTAERDQLSAKFEQATAALDEAKATIKAHNDAEAAAREFRIAASIDALVEAGRVVKDGRDALIKACLGSEDDGVALLAAIPEQKKAGREPLKTDSSKDDEPKQLVRAEFDRLDPISQSEFFRKGGKIIS